MRHIILFNKPFQSLNHICRVYIACVIQFNKCSRYVFRHEWKETRNITLRPHWAFSAQQGNSNPIWPVLLPRIYSLVEGVDLSLVDTVFQKLWKKQHKLGILYWNFVLRKVQKKLIDFMKSIVTKLRCNCRNMLCIMQAQRTAVSLELSTSSYYHVEDTSKISDESVFVLTLIFTLICLRVRVFVLVSIYSVYSILIRIIE